MLVKFQCHNGSTNNNGPNLDVPGCVHTVVRCMEGGIVVTLAPNMRFERAAEEVG